MKMFLALVAFSFSVSASTLPDKLTCISKATSSKVSNFEILDLNSLEPDSTIFDSSFLTLTSDAGQLSVSFSNQCDNWYEVKFNLNELRELQKKQRKEVTGILNYSDVELSEARNSEEPEEEKVPVICR